MSGGSRLRQEEHLSALHPGARLQSYTIGAILGAGGFGITYKAVEDITGRDVAIKEYLPTAFAVRDRDGATVRPLSEGAARDFQWGLERFREEAKLLIGFRHPNIVPVLGYFEVNGTGYLVMAFQDGVSLGDALRKTPALAQAEVLQFVVPLLDGVEEVHRHGFLHRDIKPENIFIGTDGSPVLLDFGAARQALGEHTKAFTTLLTEGYAPFEQYAGTGNQGPWTDVYALAAVMFRCLTGKAPVEAPRRAIAKLRGIADPMAQDFADLRSRVSSDLAFAIEAAMRVVEQERPQSIAALREMIVSPAAAPVRSPPTGRAAAAPAATLIPDAAMRETARHPPPWAAAKPRKSRRIVYFGAVGMVLAAAASGAAYVGDQRNWLPEAFRRAEPEAVAPAPAKSELPAPADAAKPEAEAAKRAAEAAKRAAEERAAEAAKRTAEERAAEAAKRTAEERAAEEQRAKGMAEYQRLQFETIEAERRNFEARRAAQQRKSDETTAAPDPGGATRDDEASRGEAERKRLDEEQKRRNASRPPQQPPEMRRGEVDRDGELSRPNARRDVAPGAPPSPRRMPPGEMDRFAPYPPELPGRAVPRGWRDPHYEDDY
jgi:serine/threonine protein kinase